MTLYSRSSEPDISFDHGGTVFAAAREAGCRPEDILDFSASINPLGISPGVRRACHEAIELSIHYPDPYASRLACSIAGRHGVSAEMIVPANGSTALIHLLPSVISGDSAMIVAPAFSEYENGLQKTGWRVSHHILSHKNGFTLDTDRLCSQLSAEKPSMLFFCNPGNPSGRLYGIPEIELMLHCCRDAGVTVVLDEAFMDFCGEENSFIRHLPEWHNCIILRSMTKFYAMAGIRLGFAVAPEPVASSIRKHLPPWEVNTIAQYAGIAALDDTAYSEETIRVIGQEREFLAEGINGIPGMSTFSSAANYLLVSLDTPLDAVSLKKRLFTNQRILIRDCSGFRGLDSSFIRVAVRGRNENERLLAALQLSAAGQ